MSYPWAVPFLPKSESLQPVNPIPFPHIAGFTTTVIFYFSMPILEKSNVPTIILGLEVLDNLPHDKVRVSSPTKRNMLEQAEIRQVAKDSKGSDYYCETDLEEVFVSLSDHLLSRVIDLVPSYLVNQYPTWIPTVACGVIEHVASQRPNWRLVMADFDWLPPPDIRLASGPSKRQRPSAEWARGEPLVTSMDGQDQECYLNAPPLCDILFPTDFDKLACFVNGIITESASEIPRGIPGSAAKSNMLIVKVESQSEFLQRYGPEEVEATKSWLTGHTPLLHDFSNCSVLTVSTSS